MTVRTAELMALQPPLAFGGHGFTVHRVYHDLDLFGRFVADHPDDWTLLTCRGCFVSLPAWALDEKLGSHFGLARWCPSIMRALPTASIEVSDG